MGGRPKRLRLTYRSLTTAQLRLRHRERHISPNIICWRRMHVPSRENGFRRYPKGPMAPKMDAAHKRRSQLLCGKVADHMSCTCEHIMVSETCMAALQMTIRATMVAAELTAVLSVAALLYDDQKFGRRAKFRRWRETKAPAVMARVLFSLLVASCIVHQANVLIQKPLPFFICTSALHATRTNS